jgi:hypothetical protein
MRVFPSAPLAARARDGWCRSVRPVTQKHFQSKPPLTHIVQCLCERTARQQSLFSELPIHPVEELIDSRLAMGQPVQPFALVSELQFADLLLDLVHCADLLERFVHTVRMGGLGLKETSARMSLIQITR